MHSPKIQNVPAQAGTENSAAKGAEARKKTGGQNPSAHPVLRAGKAGPFSRKKGTLHPGSEMSASVRSSSCLSYALLTWESSASGYNARRALSRGNFAARGLQRAPAILARQGVRGRLRAFAHEGELLVRPGEEGQAAGFVHAGGRRNTPPERRAGEARQGKKPWNPSCFQAFCANEKAAQRAACRSVKNQISSSGSSPTSSPSKRRCTMAMSFSIRLSSSMGTNSSMSSSIWTIFMM